MAQTRKVKTRFFRNEKTFSCWVETTKPDLELPLPPSLLRRYDEDEKNSETKE